MTPLSTDQPVRHILSLSGGKDSTALAIYMKDRIENIEYIFCDTGEELPETYEYLDKLEAYLGKSIARLNPERPFQHYLKIYNGVLPDARTRWCTRKLKIEPFEKFIGDDPCYSYIGIRADEQHRKGYISTKPNITAQYPFIENGITKADVFRLLEDSGLGLPKYYEWRSRSGCYFCFFQQRVEWVGLLENHPDLYEQAIAFETDKEIADTGEGYTWSQRESLQTLMQPERVAAIKEEYERRQAALASKPKPNQTLAEVLAMVGEDEGEEGCLICHL
jgi:3'-phosphoadenosine 5'-phosphosulfate sulfotransferase (PAPS reductase)/FAD synthetase